MVIFNPGRTRLATHIKLTKIFHLDSCQVEIFHRKVSTRIKGREICTIEYLGTAGNPSAVEQTTIAQNMWILISGYEAEISAIFGLRAKFEV